MNETITTTAATTAVTSPIWLPPLTQFNEFAALILTLSTAGWLITQSITRWREDRRKDKEFKKNHDKTSS